MPFHKPYHETLASRAGMASVTAPILSPEATSEVAIRAKMTRITARTIKTNAHTACATTTPVIQTERFIRNLALRVSPRLTKNRWKAVTLFYPQENVFPDGRKVKWRCI